LLFARLSQAFENSNAIQQKKKSRRPVAKKRLRAARERLFGSYFEPLEIKARDFNLNKLEPLLLNGIRKQSAKKKQNEPLVLFSQTVKGKGDAYRVLAKAFKILPGDRFSVVEKLSSALFVSTWFLFSYATYLEYNVNSSYAELFSVFALMIFSMLAGLVFSLLLLVLVLLMLRMHQTLSEAEDVENEKLSFFEEDKDNVEDVKNKSPSLRIFNSNYIRLPELRLFFLELKAMHLSPCISITILEEYENKDFEIFLALEISPRWNRLKNLF
jgi:hypothetical protein